MAEAAVGVRSRPVRLRGRLRPAWCALLGVWSAAGLLAAVVRADAPEMAAASTEPWLVKLGADLVAARQSPEIVTVWVSFVDKGGPADLAEALGEARASLTPRARARRERAGVWPLVDENDIPVAPRYLDALSSRGLTPFAASRWLNRVAVRVAGTRLGDVAALPFVSRVITVATARRSPDPVSPARPRPDLPPFESGPARGQRDLGAAVSYGRSLSQLSQLQLPALHDSGYTGAGVLVCILDEGFTGHDTHEALRDQPIAPGHRRDFVDGDTTVTGSGGQIHGAWVMGCIAGLKPGAYMGAAFGASWALGRTEKSGSESRVEMLYWGMGAEWADSLGADIITSSLGYFTFDTAATSYTYADMDGHTTDITRSTEIAASKGILVVNAVGNEGDKDWHFLIAPSDVNGDSLIAVGAVDEFGRVGAFSSFGPTADLPSRIKPDLSARGVDAQVVAPEIGPQGYEALDGTSFSTPLVAGLAACLMQARPSWRPVDVIRALRETASQAARPDNRIGYGIPSGAHALCWLGPGSGHPSLPPGVPAAEILGPNPVLAGGPPAQVRFAAGGFLPGSNPARIRVLDLSGRSLRELWSGSLARGQCVTVSWDGRDEERRQVHSGYYFLSLEVAGEVTTARVAWLR